MSRLPAPARVLSLIAACRDRGSIPALEAAALLGVSVSRLEEAADALTSFGVPPLGPGDFLDVEVADGEVVVHQDLALDTPLRLSAVDGAMLLACLEAAGKSLTGPLDRLREETVERLRDAITPSAAARAQDRADAVTWRDEGGLAEGLVERLHEAVLGRRELELRYYNHSRDRVQTRRAWPLRIVQHTGRWYLSAWAMPEDAHRLFRLDRMLQAELTGAAFELDRDLPDVRVDVLFTGSQERVRVEVRLPVDAAFRASRFFGTAQLVRSDDRHVVLALRGATLTLVLRQLFAFDADWEVQSPPEARELVIRWCAGPDGGEMSHPCETVKGLTA